MGCPGTTVLSLFQKQWPLAPRQALNRRQHLAKRPTQRRLFCGQPATFCGPLQKQQPDIPAFGPSYPPGVRKTATSPVVAWNITQQQMRHPNLGHPDDRSTTSSVRRKTAWSQSHHPFVPEPFLGRPITAWLRRPPLHPHAFFLFSSIVLHGLGYLAPSSPHSTCVRTIVVCVYPS